MTIQPNTTIDFDEVLKALSNPVRRGILAKMKHPEQNFPGQDHPYELGVCASKIEAGCTLSQSTISAHLAILHHAGLLTARRIGQWHFYKRNEPAITAFLEHLEDTI